MQAWPGHASSPSLCSLKHFLVLWRRRKGEGREEGHLPPRQDRDDMMAAAFARALAARMHGGIISGTWRRGCRGGTGDRPFALARTPHSKSHARTHTFLPAPHNQHL